MNAVVSVPPTFPVETWEVIFANVTRPGDLYNVVLTSRYIHDIVKPILYRRLYLDPNHYSLYTLSLLKREADLGRRVRELTLLPPVARDIPTEVRAEAGALHKRLAIPLYSSTPPLYIPQSWGTAVLHSMMPPLDADADMCSRPVFDFFPRFTGLTTLHIVDDRVPFDFLPRVYELRQLTTLDIRGSMISATLEYLIPSNPLPLQNLSIIRCWTKADLSVDYIPGNLCKGLLSDSPSLTTLTVDSFVERAACHVLSELDNPPPIRKFTCHGMGHNDPDCALLCSVLSALSTITTLQITRTPRELGLILPLTSLPNLKTLTGHIKSLAVFTGAARPLQYLTITDAPSPSGGGTPWETQLIQFLESLESQDTNIRGLAFNVAVWSEELFLCVCHLFPGLRELRIQCTNGPGVDEYFRISFGPLFLPQLQDLELLHIYERSLKHSLMTCHTSKGVPVVSRSPLASLALRPHEVEELSEAPIHYRRWEKLCPSLREVAFDRQVWWRRIESEPGGWVLKMDVLPALSQDSS